MKKEDNSMNDEYCRPTPIGLKMSIDDRMEKVKMYGCCFSNMYKEAISTFIKNKQAGASESARLVTCGKEVSYKRKTPEEKVVKVMAQGDFLATPFVLMFKDVEKVAWAGGWMDNFQLGSSIYVKVPYDTVSNREGVMRDAGDPEKSWVRVLEPIKTKNYEKGYDILLSKLGDKPLDSMLPLPGCYFRALTYVSVYSLTRSELENLLLIEGYNIILIRQCLNRLIKEEEIKFASDTDDEEISLFPAFYMH